MKKFVSGLIVGLLISTGTVFASGLVAQYNNTKVVYNDTELPLDKPLISVTEGQYASNYMPLRAVLEALGYQVDWNGEAVIISDKVVTAQADTPLKADDGNWISLNKAYEKLSKPYGLVFSANQDTLMFLKDGVIIYDGPHYSNLIRLESNDYYINIHEFLELYRAAGF